jgi:hypothetical protein
MRKFSQFIFFLLIGELIVGGGGRLFAFGPLTIRMMLFGIAVLISLVAIVEGRKLPQAFSILLISFLLCLGLALVIGISSGAERTFWFEDIKPLLYILILPFFYFVLEDHTHESLISKMIIGGAAVLAFMFFVILIAIHTRAVAFLSFYNLVINTQEFFFRAETTFFYKGFIYLCIALLFVYFTRQHQRVPLLIILSVAIVLTFTRGFIFALASTFLLYAFLERRYYMLTTSAVVIFATLFFAKPVIYQASSSLHAAKGLDTSVPKEQLLGNREESDVGRLLQAKQVLSSITPLSFFVGHGFGNGVPARPVHMEVSYLEIFHKQGVLGLAVWAYIMLLLFSNYQRSNLDPYAKAFFFSAAFIFIQSLTNQYINNPIGLSFILLALVILHRKSRRNAGKSISSSSGSHQKGDEILVSSYNL